MGGSDMLPPLQQAIACPDVRCKVMSDLIEALQSITKWVRQYMPQHPAIMNAGLTSEAINSKVKDLPFQLPEEIYELYQWHNGGKNPFIPYPEGWDLTSFFSLDEAIDEALSWKGSFTLFPLFAIEDGGYFIICTREKSQKAPVYYSDIPEQAIEREPRYSSLTSMMEEIWDELQNRKYLPIE